MSINELHECFQTMVYFIVIVMALFCFGGFCLIGCRKLKQYCYGVWLTVPKSSLAAMLIFAGIATIHAQKRPIHVNAAVEQSGDGTTKETAYKTIPEALKTVSDTGTSIIVHPGTYAPLIVTQELFPLYDKSIHTNGWAVSISTTNELGDVIVDGSNSVPTAVACYNDQHSDIRVSLSRLVVCNASTGVVGCTAISGCLITNCEDLAVSFLGTNGTVSGTTIARNGAGIDAASAISYSKVCDNKRFGATATNGLGTVSGCTIASNDGFGLIANGVVSSCVVSNNAGFGVVSADIRNSDVVLNDGFGVFGVTNVLGCLIANNAGFGINGWQTIVRNSTVANNYGYGLCNAYALFGSVITNNAGSGVVASIVKNSLIADNDGDGLTGATVVTDSRVIGNAGSGVLGHEGSMTNIVVSHNGGNGVSNATVVLSKVEGNGGLAAVDIKAVNCLLVGNGSGVVRSQLYSSTLADNNRRNDACAIDTQTEAYNSILWNNGDATNCDSNRLHYCITRNPYFRPGEYRLHSDSPCIEAACSEYVYTSTDIQGNTRIQGPKPDVGAYEYGAVPASQAASYTKSSPIAVPKTWLHTVITNMPLSAFNQWFYDNYRQNDPEPNDWDSWHNYWNDNPFFVKRILYYPSIEDANNKTNGHYIYTWDYEKAAMYSFKTDSRGRAIPVWEEYLFGTDPNNTNDFFQIQLNFEEGAFSGLSWTPDLGSERCYTVESSNLKPPVIWIPTDDPVNCSNTIFKVNVDLW